MEYNENGFIKIEIKNLFRKATKVIHKKQQEY